MPEHTDRPDRLRLLLDQFTANAVQASRAMRADRSDEARTAHQTIAAIWTQAAHLLSQTIKQAHGTRTTGNNPPTSADGVKNLIQVGWYCWRCQAINAQACRSDSVPVHVPAEWASEMEAEIARRDDESDDTTPAEEGAADRRYWNGRYDREGS
jgi:hypothetical protein